MMRPSVRISLLIIAWGLFASNTVLAQASSDTTSAFDTAFAPAQAEVITPAPGGDTEDPPCNPTESEYSFYERPPMPQSLFRSWAWHLTDMAALTFMLLGGTWIVLQGTGRLWFDGLAILSIAFFGFVKGGCICAVGSVGNVGRAIFQPDAVLPISAIVFFLFPLILALMFGRVFCGTTCPFGAVQRLLAWRPHRVPGKLDRILRLGPWLVLAATIVAAVSAASFSVCKIDPFVHLFRMSAHSPYLWAYSVLFLLLCVWIPHPFCRWMCPYSVLLGLTSKLAIRKRQLDGSKCDVCQHCADQCPVQAIDTPKLDFSACIQCGRCRSGCKNQAWNWKRQ